MGVTAVGVAGVGPEIIEISKSSKRPNCIKIRLHFKDSSENCQECLKKISRKLERCFKKICVLKQNILKRKKFQNKLGLSYAKLRPA